MQLTPQCPCSQWHSESLKWIRYEYGPWAFHPHAVARSPKVNRSATALGIIVDAFAKYLPQALGETTKHLSSVSRVDNRSCIVDPNKLLDGERSRFSINRDDRDGASGTQCFLGLCAKNRLIYMQSSQGHK